MFGNRWYDKHPKVSLAVGCLENADPVLRNKIAKLIIKQGIVFKVQAKRPQVGFFRRWYDKDKDLSLAMEYFKCCDDKQRLEIAEQIIINVRSQA